MIIDTVINALIAQAPNSAALIIVIILFLHAIDAREARYSALMTERDQQYLEALKELIEKVDSLHTAFDIHDIRSSNAIEKVNKSKKI